MDAATEHLNRRALLARLVATAVVAGIAPRIGLPDRPVHWDATLAFKWTGADGKQYGKIGGPLLHVGQTPIDAVREWIAEERAAENWPEQLGNGERGLIVSVGWAPPGVPEAMGDPMRARWGTWWRA